MIIEITSSILLTWFIWFGISTYLTKRKMPPGPIPFPWIGNLPQLFCYPTDPINKLAEKYGDIFTLFFPTGPAVFLNSARLARDARLDTKDGLAGKTGESMYPLKLLFGESLGFTDYSPAFNFRKRVFKSGLHLFGDGIVKIEGRARHAVQMIMEEIESNESHTFSPKKLTERAILVQIWEWLTSNRLPRNDPIINCLARVNEIFAYQAFESTTYQVFPLLRFFSKRLQQDLKHFRKVKEEILIPEFRAHLESYQPDVIRDLTDSFIDSFKKEVNKKSGKDIGCIDDVVNLMLDVTVGGSETTSTSLAWTFLYIALYPNVQKRILEELDYNAKNDHLSSLGDAEKMHFLQATLCEVQRIATVAGKFGTNATRDISINGYEIPKGAFVFLNNKKIHFNEEDWSEPEKFKPERFLDEEEKFVGWTTLYGFMPFGLGRRECPGQNVARIMLFTFIATFFRFYKIDFPKGAQIPSTKAASDGIIAQPQEFTLVAFKRR